MSEIGIKKKKKTGMCKRCEWCVAMVAAAAVVVVVAAAKCVRACVRVRCGAVRRVVNNAGFLRLGNTTLTDFVHEDDTGLVFARVSKHLADHACGLADVLVHNRRRDNLWRLIK